MVFSNSLRKAINKCSTLREFLRLQIINRTNVVCTKLACFVQNGHGSYKTFPFSVQSGRWFVQLVDILCRKFWAQKVEFGKLILIPKLPHILDHELLRMSVPN